MPLLGKRQRERQAARAEPQVAQLYPLSLSDNNENVSSDESNDGSAGSGSVEEEQDDVRSIFARHFSKHFQPLGPSDTPNARRPKPQKPKGAVIEDLRDDESDDLSQNGSESDSEGFSGFDDEDTVQVVEHSLPSKNVSNVNGISARDKRAFMSSKPPSSTSATSNSKPQLTSTKDDNDDQDAQNLKNDLALQRLLSESHLLQTSSNPSSTSSHSKSLSQSRPPQSLISEIPSAERNLRQKTTDLRLHALGAHKSILQQQKMPASHLKGIREKTRQKEALRRKEAKESGVILERPGASNNNKISSRGSKGNSGGLKGRQRIPRGTVGDAKIGKFSGATLRLSRADLQEIKGSRPFGGARRGGSKRGGRGGGLKRRN